jgi:hypothetical protein
MRKRCLALQASYAPAHRAPKAHAISKWDLDARARLRAIRRVRVTCSSCPVRESIKKSGSIRGDGIAGWGFPFPSGSATKQSNDDGNDDPDYSRPSCDLGPEQCVGSCFLLAPRRSFVRSQLAIPERRPASSFHHLVRGQPSQGLLRHRRVGGERRRDLAVRIPSAGRRSEASATPFILLTATVSVPR